MPRLIDADAFIADARMAGLDTAEKVLFALSHQPTIEPNLILPERMERGECYEVGETIVVLNHDDYYDLLCKPTVDKDYLISLIQEAVYDGEACKRLLDLVDRPQGEWINVGTYEECKDCGEVKRFPHWNFCPDCGARMTYKDIDVLYKIASDQRDYDSTYEPTYNEQDGSM